jgi:hypothetical protein
VLAGVTPDGHRATTVGKILRLTPDGMYFVEGIAAEEDDTVVDRLQAVVKRSRYGHAIVHPGMVEAEFSSREPPWLAKKMINRRDKSA